MAMLDYIVTATKMKTLKQLQNEASFVGSASEKASAPKSPKKADQLSVLSDQDLHKEIGARVADDILDHYRNEFSKKNGRFPESPSEHHEVFKKARSSTSLNDTHANLSNVIRVHTDNALRGLHHKEVNQSTLPKLNVAPKKSASPLLKMALKAILGK